MYQLQIDTWITLNFQLIFTRQIGKYGSLVIAILKSSNKAKTRRRKNRISAPQFALPSAQLQPASNTRALYSS